MKETARTTYGKTAKVGAVWAIAQQTISQVIQFGAGIVLARLLSPYDFGIAAAVGFFLRLGNKLSSIGFGSALVRLSEVRPEHRSSVFVAGLVMSVTMWLALTIGAPALATTFNNDQIASALRVGALIFLLLPFGVGQLADMNRQFRFKPQAIIGWTYSVAFFVLSIGLAVAGFQFWSLIWGTLLANAAATLVKIYLGGVQPKLRFSKAAFMEVVPFGAGIQAKRILTFFAEYIDTLIVGRALGLTALGFYDKAFSTMDRVVDRLAVGPTVFFRIFSIIRDDRDRLRRAYQKSVLGAGLIGLPSFAVLIVLAPELIPFVYGEQWRPSVVPFQVLCLAGALRVSSAYASAATQAQGQIWSEITRLCLYVGLVVAGAVIGAQAGIVGVAIGVTVANLTIAVLMQTLVCRITQLAWRDVLTPQLPGLYVSAVLVLVMIAAAAMLNGTFPAAPEWQRLLVKTLAAGFTGLLIFLRPPLARIRELRDEALIDVAPWLRRYLPAWAGVPAAGQRRPVQNGSVAPAPSAD